MNLLKSQGRGDVHKIVSIMKNSIENRQGKQWSLNEDQTLWLKNQIANQIRASLKSKNNMTPGKIVLGCSIKFTPQQLASRQVLAKETVKLEGSKNQQKNDTNSNSEESKRTKVLHMKCKNLSIKDCDTDDTNKDDIPDLKSLIRILSSDKKEIRPSEGKNEGRPPGQMRKRDFKRLTKHFIEWPQELQDNRFESDRDSFEQMFQTEDYNSVVLNWLCSKPV
ncbi:unnamed protein product [Moneuplotes crassus]|uniref:Uncharacterized protein n=1 Tax=Euplotes crassus TaxID=5936 RepID=A0AAD1UIC9_EUPCR|nr:unnamed protein product [Moneuplotes crassus]